MSKLGNATLVRVSDVVVFAGVQQPGAGPGPAEHLLGGASGLSDITGMLQITFNRLRRASSKVNSVTPKTRDEKIIAILHFSQSPEQISKLNAIRGGYNFFSPKLQGFILIFANQGGGVRFALQGCEIPPSLL